MAKRYELPDAAWDLVADIFYEPRRSGRPRANDRLMLNGVLWVLCSGAAWRDMPERFGPWSTVYQRFRDWRNRGAFDQMLKRLHIKLNEQGLIDLETWMIDSTAVRATRASSDGWPAPCDVYDITFRTEPSSPSVHRRADPFRVDPAQGSLLTLVCVSPPFRFSARYKVRAMA